MAHCCRPSSAAQPGPRPPARRHVKSSLSLWCHRYAAFSNSFYFLVDAERSSISGYKAAPKVASKAEGKAGASAALWTFRLGEGEKWATMATRHPDEAVQSPVRVLGDGAAMYKHLNPNLLLVARRAAPPS